MKVIKRASAVLLLVVLGGLVWANWPMSALPADAKTSRLVVHKSTHELQLYAGDQVLKTYSVALGRGGQAPKEHRGDGRTPEGHYVLDARNPGSRFHRAFHVSYPSAADSAMARAKGLDPGGSIELHGLPDRLAWVGRLHRLIDWTDGCIGVTNAEIEELWRVVPVGTVIEIRP